jgi:hypothetical protein
MRITFQAENMSSGSQILGVRMRKVCHNVILIELVNRNQ